MANKCVAQLFEGNRGSKRPVRYSDDSRRTQAVAPLQKSGDACALRRRRRGLRSDHNVKEQGMASSGECAVQRNKTYVPMDTHQMRPPLGASCDATDAACPDRSIAVICGSDVGTDLLSAKSAPPLRRKALIVGLLPLG